MEKEKLIELVESAQNGQDDAATALYDAFQKDLYYHISKTVNDPVLAEDLLQDTFIEILQTINNLNEPAAFLSWSKQIAYHKCTAHFKKRKDILSDESEDGFSVFDTLEEDNAEFIPDKALDKEDLKQTIHGMINQLPEDQRSALLLRYFDELSVKEIAEIQGVTEGTVKSRLNYGRKAIKDSVEDYEKKNGVKLRCAGVIPLLLWLFREFSISNGISLTSTTASTAYTAAKATTPLIAEAVKTGAKTTGKFAVKKLVASIAAAAVVAGGAATAIFLQPQKQPQEEKSMVWVGYGILSHTYTRRFELTVDDMNNKTISGHLEVSHLYEKTHDTEFTGTGTLKDGEVIYDITFETPAVIGTIPTFEYSEMQLEYDKKSEQFSFSGIYDVEMDRQNNQKPKVLAENESWSGVREDGFDNVLKSKNHQFTLNVYKITEKDINGSFSVSYNGDIEHKSEFTGRGYQNEDIIYYEILLKTPRTETYLWGDSTIDSFWLKYNTKTNQFIISSGMYSAEMEKK